MTIEDAARFLALGRSKTYELIAEGSLPTVRIGRAVRIPTAALREWVDLRVRESAQPAMVR
jgi:excisionase family DNA binding protein